MKFIVLILALAAYGAYSLLASIASSNSEPSLVAAPVASSPKGLLSGLSSTASDFVVGAAESVTGLEVQPLPEFGCSGSALSPSQVLALIDQLPEAQRTTLAKLLDVSSPVWSAQLYTSEAGVGLCLPGKGKLIKLPGVQLSGWAPSTEGVADFVRSATDVVSTTIQP